MYPQCKPYESVSASLSPGRFLSLVLTFVTGAVVACSLAPLLAPARYTLSPAEGLALPGCLAAVTDALPLPVTEAISRMLGSLRGMAWETLAWGLAVCLSSRLTAGPALPLLLSLWRGSCFGVVLSLVTAAGESQLTGGSLPRLLIPLAVTAALLVFAAGITGESRQEERMGRKRFLTTAGIVFALTLAGALLPCQPFP